MLKTKVAVLVGALAVSGMAYADLNTGLMAHYSFDDCSANDSSTNNNHGKVNGNLSCIAGAFNKALQFDGASYINVPNSASLNPVKQFTMSFWVRIDAPPPLRPQGWGIASIFYKGYTDFGCYLGRQYSFWLASNSNGVVNSNFEMSGDNDCSVDDQTWAQTYTGSKNVAKVGQWQHVVGVFDRVKHRAKIYINGKLRISEVDGYSTFNNTDNDLLIGYGAEGYSYFQGALDEIRLYNRALSSTEVSALYALVKPVGATLQGFNSYTATCANTSTGKRITIPASVNPAFDCEKAGLVVNPKDNVTLTIKGNVH